MTGEMMMSATLEIFCFEIRNGATVIADAGGHLCSIREAEQIAQGLAEELIRKEPELVGLGYAVLVKSEAGVVHCRIGLDDVHRRLAN
jgi:hypothetical protein